MQTLHDNRASQRFAYPFQQRTSIVEERGATVGAFDSRLFHDISLGGCSFWSTQPLSCRHVWIELGRDDDCLTRLAEVRHETKVECLARPLYLVGCRFLTSMAANAASGEHPSPN